MQIYPSTETSQFNNVSIILMYIFINYVYFELLHDHIWHHLIAICIEMLHQKQYFMFQLLSSSVQSIFVFCKYEKIMFAQTFLATGLPTFHLEFFATLFPSKVIGLMSQIALTNIALQFAKITPCLIILIEKKSRDQKSETQVSTGHLILTTCINIFEDSSVIKS